MSNEQRGHKPNPKEQQPAFGTEQEIREVKQRISSLESELQKAGGKALSANELFKKSNINWKELKPHEKKGIAKFLLEEAPLKKDEIPELIRKDKEKAESLGKSFNKYIWHYKFELTPEDEPTTVTPQASGSDGQDGGNKPPVVPGSPESDDNDENGDVQVSKEVINPRLEELRRRIKVALPDWEPKRKKKEKGEDSDRGGQGENKTYKNIERGEELIVGILDMAGALNDGGTEWGIDGEHCLIDENGVVNLHNYRLWYRKKIYEACVVINPTDTVNLWGKGGSGIEIKISGVKSYGVGDLLRETPCWIFTQYDRTKPPKIDANGNALYPTKEVNMEDSLKHAVEADVYQANKLHNIGLSLKNARSKGFAETYLAQMSDGALSGNLGLSDLYQQKDTSKAETDKLLEGEAQNGSMGKAARFATLGYYYLSEAVASPNMYKGNDAKNMFNEVMGKDALDAFWGNISEAVIKKELTTLTDKSTEEQKAIKVKIRDIEKRNSEKKSGEVKEDWKNDPDVLQAMKKALKFTDDDNAWGKLWNDKRNLAERAFRVIKDEKAKDGKTAVSGLNFFSQVQPNSEYIDLVRGGMTAAIQKKANTDEFTAKYADFLTSKTWDVLGMYGNNDVETGFSLAGRYKNILAYRMKNAGTKANLEKAGNRWNLYDIKQMYVDPLQGLTVREQGRGGYEKSLLEILQGGDCKHLDVTGNLNAFDFKEGALRQYASDHMLNAEKVGQELMDPAGFSYVSKGLDWNKHGEIEWDDAWYKNVTGMWHDLRYSFNNPSFNYKQNVQVPVLNVEGKVVGYEIKTLEESMFSDDLRKLLTGKIEEQNKDKKEVLPKNAMMMLYMHEIKSHRIPWSGKPQWSDMEVAKIEAAFKALPIGAEDVNGEVLSSANFVTDIEWKRAEKHNLPKISAEKAIGKKFSLLFNQLGEAGVTPMVGGLFQGLGAGFWALLMEGLKD